MMKLRTHLKRLIRKAGFDLVKYESSIYFRERRLYLFSKYKINLIFDIGANIGQYASTIRNDGYRGRIISFEPLSSAYEQLQENAKNDNFWECANFALGKHVGKGIINISKYSQSSSLLEMLPTHLQAAPESSYIGKEEIMIKSIDSIINNYFSNGDNLFLKIDAQGYERYILEGAESSFDKIIGLELEMSLVPLYEGDYLFSEMLDYLYRMGYLLIFLAPGFASQKTGQLLQVDGLFFK